MENNSKTKLKTKKKSFELKFPWWFKIFAYMLSFLFAGVSLFFVVVKGIEFGDGKVTKWLTSLIISFLSSILLYYYNYRLRINGFSKVFFQLISTNQN